MQKTSDLGGVSRILALFQTYLGNMNPDNALKALMTIIYYDRRSPYSREQLDEIGQSIKAGQDINLFHYLAQLQTGTLDMLINILTKDHIIQENIDEYLANLGGVANYSGYILNQKMPQTEGETKERETAANTIVTFTNRLLTKDNPNIDSDRIALLMDIIAHTISRSRAFLIDQLFAKRVSILEILTYYFTFSELKIIVRELISSNWKKYHTIAAAARA